MSSTAGKKLRSALVVTVVTTLGVALVGYYWAYLKRDELRSWNEITVEFKDVGGLKKKDPVQLQGARIGRVKSIQLFEARQSVVLQIDGELTLYNKKRRIVIVPRNALGRVAIEIAPGDPTSGRFGEPCSRCDQIGDQVVLELKEAQRSKQIRGLSRETGDGRTRRCSGCDAVFDYEVSPSSVLTVKRIKGPEVPLGTLRESITISGGGSARGRQKELKRQLDDFARETKRALNPDGNVIGTLLFSKARYQETRTGLKELARTWEEIDRGLAEFEVRQAKEGMLSRQSYLIAAQTLESFERTMTQLRTGFRRANRGEGTAGRLLADPGAANGARALIADTSTSWKQTRRHEGTLGRLVDPSATEVDALRETVKEVEQLTAEADRGEGFLGTLSSPEAGENVRQALSGIEATFRRLREAQSGESAREDVEDTLGNLDDFLLKLRRALYGIRAGFSDKTFHGAVFSVF
ncbi:MAG: MCE family protein [Planctomycetes bacterium]|nr:MCE family protein [Planctomycetota bacterium]